MIDLDQLTEHLTIPKKEIADRDQIEGAVAWRYGKLGYDWISSENQMISTLWGLICLEPMLWSPSWDKWDKAKSPADYPELLEYSTIEDISFYEQTRHVPLEWIYSKQCFDLNGYPTTLPNGAHYLLLREKIDTFIDQLEHSRVIELIKDNDHYVRNKMKMEYERLPRTLMTYPFDFESLESEEEQPLYGMFQLANALPIDAIKYICRQFFKNWHKYRTGFPDLWLLSETGELLLVEVKRPREQVRENQLYWIAKLLEFGISVQIARVHSN